MISYCFHIRLNFIFNIKTRSSRHWMIFNIMWNICKHPRGCWCSTKVEGGIDGWRNFVTSRDDDTHSRTQDVRLVENSTTLVDITRLDLKDFFCSIFDHQFCIILDNTYRTAIWVMSPRKKAFFPPISITLPIHNAVSNIYEEIYMFCIENIQSVSINSAECDIYIFLWI